MSKGKLFVISGASGVGKSTVLKKVMDDREDLYFSVSATTRAPRAGEVDGVNYHFVTRPQFEEMIAKGEFLEYDEHHNDRKQGYQYFLKILRNLICKYLCYVLNCLDTGDRNSGIYRISGIVEAAQYHNRENGSDTRHSNKTEAVA